MSNHAVRSLSTSAVHRAIPLKLVVCVCFTMLLLLSMRAVQAQSSEFPLTDFSKRSVEMSEILSGGPPRDGIPSIDSPEFVSIDTAAGWLKPDEPVVYFEHNGDARAYPLQILMFHEIVNDTVGGKPVSVTFCPLCNASIVYDRTVGGQVLDFGTTGRLRNSDLVMYDRQTETWWQQFNGMGIIGELTDTSLIQLDSQIISFETFSSYADGGTVLSRETGFQRMYGTNPYVGYDSIHSKPFLFRGKLDDRLPPMERILSVLDGDRHHLITLSNLEKNPVFNTVLEKKSVVVFASTSATSALDKSSIADSRRVPAAAAFDAGIDVGNVLTFELNDGKIIDTQSQSEWTPLGKAVSGKFKGTQLKQLDKGVHFAFAWLAFDPEATIVSPSGD